MRHSAIKAKTKGKAWLRTGLSLVIAVVLQNAYLVWLHSESFPEALLSQRGKEWKMQTQDAGEEKSESGHKKQFYEPTPIGLK